MVAMLIYGNFIDSDPKILSGKPRIKDTRVSVEHILNELAGRMSLKASSCYMQMNIFH